jgi:hypothetical protein
MVCADPITECSICPRPIISPPEDEDGFCGQSIAARCTFGNDVDLPLRLG